jgi:hypothetical protein
MNNLIFTSKKLIDAQAITLLRDDDFFNSCQQSIEKILHDHQLLTSLDKQDLKIMTSNLKLFSKVAGLQKHLDPKFKKLSEQCNQLLCQLISLDKSAAYHEPLVLELKDYLKSLETPNALHHFYYHLLGLLEPLSRVLLGVNLALDKTQLPEYTATQKLIKIIEEQEEQWFTPEERTQFYKGTLGQIIEKYQLANLFLNEHTHLPMQK